MKTHLLATALAAIIGSLALPAAAENLARFDGGIGVTPATFAGGAAAANDVLGVAPGGRPWVINRLRGSVKADGSISVRGDGLILAGGNTIGTAGAITQVIATLFCNAQPFNSQPAPLDRDGDFDISGMLSATPPSPCINPVLLIRNGAGGNPGAWFAAGIPK